MYFSFICLIGISIGHIYAKNTFSETSKLVFNTIKDEDWHVDDYVFPAVDEHNSNIWYF